MKIKDVDRVEFYVDAANEWRWRYRAAGNSEVLADSGEGYHEFRDCRDAASRATGRTVRAGLDSEGTIGPDEILGMLEPSLAGTLASLRRASESLAGSLRKIRRPR